MFRGVFLFGTGIKRLHQTEQNRAKPSKTEQKLTLSRKMRIDRKSPFFRVESPQPPRLSLRDAYMGGFFMSTYVKELL